MCYWINFLISTSDLLLGRVEDRIIFSYFGNSNVDEKLRFFHRTPNQLKSIVFNVHLALEVFCFTSKITENIKN